MKRLSLYVFLVLTFFFTTAGLFKSDLEECADFKIKSWIKFNRTAVFKTVPLTEEEQEKAKEIYETEMVRLDKKYHERHECGRIKYESNRYGSSKLKKACVTANKYRFFTPSLKTKKQVKVRDISEYENKKKYKKYIKMPLNKKLRFADNKESWALDVQFGREYEKNYLACVGEKKKNPELFKGKYD